MARTRMVKPELFTDKKMGQVGVAARYLFIGLWTLADREGRLVDAPNMIAGSLFPFDTNVEVDSLLGELVRNGQIKRYQAKGEPYIQIMNFVEHQKPHPNERPSLIPASGSCKSHKRVMIKVEAKRAEFNTGIRIPDNESPADAVSPIVEFYNSICQPAGLPKCLALSDKRRGFLNARIAENPDFYWTAYFTRVSKSLFLCGQNDRGWRADFEWLIRPENFLKVNEGKYDNREGVTSRPQTQQEKDDDAVLNSMRRSMARNGKPEDNPGGFTKISEVLK